VDVGATTDRIELTPFLQAFLPETSLAPVTLLSSEVNISESLKGIISAAISQDSSKINPRGKAEARLKVNDGRVLATSTVNAGRVNVAAETSRIELTPFLQDIPVPVTLLESKVDFSESLQAIVSAAVSQDFTQIDPNATANASRKVAQLLSMAPVERDFLPTQLNIRGDAEFEGRLLAKNILLDPLTADNLNLTGDLELRDFAFNEMKFDRVLTGPVKADPAREIAINLRGKKDAISAQLISNPVNCTWYNEGRPQKTK